MRYVSLPLAVYERLGLARQIVESAIRDANDGALLERQLRQDLSHVLGARSVVWAAYSA